jgi:hypothetical protein
VPNFVRANFSPGKTTAEQLGDSFVVTDTESGKRMIIGANGKTKLFDGEKVSIHDSPEQAEARANKDSVAQARFSPKGGDGFKVGNEVTVLIKGVPQEAKLLKRVKSAQGGVYYQVDIPGSALVDSNSIRPKGYVDPDAAMTPEGGAAPAPSLAELLRAKTPKRITKQQAATIQQAALDSRSSTASLVDKAEKLYADGVITREEADSFNAAVKSPEAQSTKTRKEVRQAALNALNIPEIAAPVQLEFDMFMGIPEQLKQEPMPGAEERVAAATAKVEADRQAVVDRAIKKVQDKRMMDVAKTPSSLTGGRMEEMYGAIGETFSKRGIFGPIPKTPSSLESMATFKADIANAFTPRAPKTPRSLESLASFKEDIAKVFTPQMAEQLTRSNPLVRREEIAVQLDNRTQAQRKKHSDQMLALAKRENALRYRESQRMEKLESRLESLQAKQRAKASAQRAKEIANLLNQRDRMEAEADVMIKREREAAMANAMRGEAMEAASRRGRTAERASVMEQLLRERDAQMAQPESAPVQPESQPESQAAIPPGMVQSSEVPPGVNLFKTKSGKFKVVISSGQAIGITDEYRDAVKLAQRYATKALSNRKGVR